MSEGWKVGKRARILSDIGKELKDDRDGTVVYVDGAYVLIELDKSKVHVERYSCEITELWSIED